MLRTLLSYKNTSLRLSTCFSNPLILHVIYYTLEIIGTFSCKVSVGNHTTDAEFCVISRKGEPLLVKDTAIMLGVLKIGIGISQMRITEQRRSITKWVN